MILKSNKMIVKRKKKNKNKNKKGLGNNLFKINK